MSDDLFGAAASSLSTALTAGVTTVRDLGGPLEILTALKEAQEVGDIAASRVIAAGPALSAPGGHGLDSGHGVAIATPVVARNMVAALARTPTQWIKVVTSGARGNIQMPRETFEAIMTQAHDSGIPVAAHAHFQGDQLRTAVQLGVRTVEHGFLLHQQPHLAEQMANAGTFLCATTRVVESIREDPNWYGQKLIPGAWDDVRASTALAFREGVQVVAGTDAGVFGAHFGEVWREVELLKETTEPWAALAAATSTAAAALGRPDLGSLLAGSRADVVVVRRDPLSSEVTADDVVAVFQGGQLVSGTLNPVPPYSI